MTTESSMKYVLIYSLGMTLCCLLITACGTTEKATDGDADFGDYSVEYKKSPPAERLAIPPDLSSSRVEDAVVAPERSAASYSEYEKETPGQPFGILPAQEDIEVIRDGDKRWLVIQAAPEQLWPKLREFWLDFGFLLTIEDSQIGIMETDWKENRADIPDDIIRDFLKPVLDAAYSAPTRDSFRLRIEKSDKPDHTEVFVSHRGVLQKVSGESIVWETRPAEPELEAEILRRLIVYLGIEDEKARARLARTNQRNMRAKIIKDRKGNSLIDYQRGYPRAWRIVGLVLDRVGFTVEDRDRSRGIYYVRYSDPLADIKSGEQGILSGLIFWGSDEKPSSDQYQVNLAGDEASTQIVVLDEDGERDSSKTAQRILSLIYEQIK